MDETKNLMYIQTMRRAELNLETGTILFIEQMRSVFIDQSPA